MLKKYYWVNCVNPLSTSIFSQLIPKGNANSGANVFQELKKEIF